jgi:hypothetical protein
LVTLGFVFWELEHARTLSWYSLAPILLTLLGTVLLTIYYSHRTITGILATAKQHADRSAAAREAAAAAAAAVPAGATVQAAPAPLPPPRWNPL